MGIRDSLTSQVKTRMSRRSKTSAAAKKADRNAPAPPPPIQYNSVGVSLTSDELDWLKSVERSLKVVRAPRANRSFILQRALRYCAEQLEGKNAREIAAWFARLEVEHLANGSPPLQPPEDH